MGEKSPQVTQISADTNSEDCSAEDGSVRPNDCRRQGILGAVKRAFAEALVRSHPTLGRSHLTSSEASAKSSDFLVGILSLALMIQSCSLRRGIDYEHEYDYEHDDEEDIRRP